MKTDDLIRALAADTRRRPSGIGRMLVVAAVVSVAVAFVVFLATLGPRSDLAAAAATVRFNLKWIAALVLAGSALALLEAVARPDGDWRRALLLAAAPAMLGLAVAAEMAVLPAEAWPMAAIGKNALVCLTFIPLIGAGPLASFIWFLRRGAPVRPALAGAAAGLAAGGIAAGLYAFHCTDDSPFFVAIWYTTAIAGLTLAGAVAGRFATRW